MKLSSFIRCHMDQILRRWDEYARTLTPAADSMTLASLRDHAEEMLRTVALDMESPQSVGQQQRKSMGYGDGLNAPTAASAASEHGRLRYDFNFTLIQLVSEFRALRASVLELWLQRVDTKARDVSSDLMRFNEAIDQALAESTVTFSQRVEQSRDMFDAILGHDLRGPLSSVTMAGERLAQGGLPEAKAMELAGHVKRSARYMTAMVEDLLDFTRSRLGGSLIAVRLEPTDLAKVCTYAIADAGAMHPDCEFELMADTRVDAHVDTDRAHQLLVNLLGNACQHGEPGRPVQMHVAGDEDNAVLSVINEGRPVPADSLERIFEPMLRLASSNGSRSLGLGLYVARAIALAHGGSISVDSDPQQTKFIVRIPRYGQGEAQCGDETSPGSLGSNRLPG